MARRGHGKLTFLDVVDRSGRIQLLVSADRAGEVDVHDGDIVGATGHPAKSRRGEPSLAGGQPRASRDDQGAAPRHLPRPDRRRAALPPALPRPADERGDAGGLPAPHPDRRGHPAAPRRRRLRRGRDADPPGPLRRRLRTAVRHPPQPAEPGSLPPDRDRALPEAPDRRRPRAGLRDRPRLPQRGRRLQAQPRVHDAGVVRGLRRLPRHDGTVREPDRGRRGGRARHDEGRLSRPRNRPEAALAPAEARGRARRARRLVDATRPSFARSSKATASTPPRTRPGRSSSTMRSRTGSSRA